VEGRAVPLPRLLGRRAAGLGAHLQDAADPLRPAPITQDGREMIDRRASWSMPLLAVMVAGGSFALGSRAPSVPAPSEAPEREPPRRAAPPPSGPLSWIVAGGGASPDSNQVQLEQDIALGRE